MFRKILTIAFLANLILFQCHIVLAEIIEDDVALQSFKGQVLSKPVYKKEMIEDECAQDFKDKNLIKPVFKQVLLEDKFIENRPDVKTCTKHIVHYKFIDENAEIVKIPVSAVNLITTKDGLKLGQTVEFKVTKDVYKNGQLFIKNGTSVSAIVELISKAERYGDPDEIELGRFSTKDVKSNTVELVGNVRKQGADRGKWAKPLYYMGASVPYPCGILMVFYFVKGGKTNIKPEQTFELYYE